MLPDQERLKTPFLTALQREWALRLPQLQGKKVVSIYFGGGTPTKLPPEEYAFLLEMIQASPLEIAPDCEITLEANPEDVTLPRMQQYRKAGINRVSIGVQSLSSSELILLGRTHTALKAISAIEEAHTAGFENISIDLMFELPDQTLMSWEKTLQKAATLPITHLSLYNLTFEPHTLFFKQKEQWTLRLPPDEERLAMLQMAIDQIPLPRYEISAFAKPGYLSKHNTGYWTARPFLGFGPSAFSYWEKTRFSNAIDFNFYLKALEESRFPVTFEEQLPWPRNLQELLTIQLRLTDGVDLEQFTLQQGKIPSSLEEVLKRLIEKGWLNQEKSILKLTPLGQLFYDSVAVELI